MDECRKKVIQKTFLLTMHEEEEAFLFLPIRKKVVKLQFLSDSDHPKKQEFSPLFNEFKVKNFHALTPFNYCTYLHVSEELPLKFLQILLWTIIREKNTSCSICKKDLFFGILFIRDRKCRSFRMAEKHLKDFPLVDIIWKLVSGHVRAYHWANSLTHSWQDKMFTKTRTHFDIMNLAAEH